MIGHILESFQLFWLVKRTNILGRFHFSIRVLSCYRWSSIFYFCMLIISGYVVVNVEYILAFAYWISNPLFRLNKVSEVGCSLCSFWLFASQISSLAQRHPGLMSLRSVDLSPASWMAVAWLASKHSIIISILIYASNRYGINKIVDRSNKSYRYPIYHIPTGRTIRDLQTCFLTYHTLSSSFQGKNSHYHHRFFQEFHPLSWKIASKFWGLICKIWT